MTSQFKHQLRLGAGSLALALAITAAPSVAQEADASDEDLIIVTGSRIASATVESAAPLQLVDAESIQDSGVTNI